MNKVLSGIESPIKFAAVALLVLCVLFPAASSAGEYKYRLTLPASAVISGSPVNPRITVNSADRFLDMWDEGLPVVPYRTINVLIPQGEEFDYFEVTSGSYSLVTKAFSPTIAPRATSEDGISAKDQPFTGWSADSRRYPDQRAVYLGTGYMRGYAVASFAVFPVAVQDGDLVVYENIDVTMFTRAADSGLSIAIRERYREGFRQKTEQELASLVLNKEAIGEYSFQEIHVQKEPGGFQATSFPSLEGSPVDYVIITNDSLAAAYQALADFKTTKGVPTVIRTTEWIEANYRNGSDLQETIRNFVKDAYSKWGIQYVLLGGDTDQVPARLAWSGYYDGGRMLPADMYYVCLDGDWNADGDDIFGEQPPSGSDYPDLFAELNIGRLPTQTTDHVDLMTAKIIDYESPVNFSFNNKIMFLAEVLFWTGNTISLNGADFAEYLYQTYMQDPGLDVARLYETYNLFPGAVPESRAAAIDSMNAGYDHVIHVGHGFRFNMSTNDASVMNTDADSLTNGTALSNYYLLNCTALAYTYFCLAEHFLLAPNGGGVSTVGANESAFPNASSYYMYEYYNLLFSQGEVHIGDVFRRSRLPRTPLAGIIDNVDLWTHYIYTILADPEMPLWTNQVDTLAVSHTPTVGMGTSTIVVTVNVGGSPVDSAMVCLSKGTDDYQYGSTDGSGQVSFDFRAESAGDIKVVATGRNHARYDGTITVTGSSSAYVSYNDMTVDDDSTGGTWGNGDGVIDAGETVDLMLEVVNSGGTASGNVTLVLRSSDLDVTITDSTATVGVVAGSGGTTVAGDAVRVVFASSLTDESSVGFDLEISEDGSPAWDDTFRRVVHAPLLDVVIIRIDDSILGNGDGAIQAGEIFDLYYELKNFGTGVAYGLTAELTDIEGAFTFVDSTDTYPDIAPQVAAENTGEFRMSEAWVTTDNLLEVDISDAYGRTRLDTIELRRPDPPSNLSFDPSLGVDRLSVRWDASTSPDVARYNAYRSSVQGGPYTIVNTDPVDHTVYLDTGLAASTPYFYVATAIDASGNESAPSAEGTGSTNPPQIQGFPIKMIDPTVSSPVIGDIDGDGDLEIVQGDKKVYAWHHNGVEITDGDDDPQTWGVLTTRGDEFISPIALGRIDYNPGLEIVAASRDSMMVFVFDHTGGDVPGWPQYVENFIRAAMVVGDINADNILEVIALDEGGVLYVWGPDGNEYRDGDSNPMTPGVFYRFPGCVYQYGAPVIADIDNDGVNEIVVATHGDSLYVLNEDGTMVPGWPVYINSDASGSPVVGDIDGDGGGDLEIAVNTYLGHLRAFHHDGTVLFTKWQANSLTFGPSPALGDLDNNGDLETVIPGADGKLYIVRSDGTNYPAIVYNSATYTESSPVIADLDGNGVLDVLLGDETQLIKAWDASGNMVDGFPLATGDAMRGVPTITDVDGDGDIEIFAGGWDGNMYAWNLNTAYDKTLAPWTSYGGNRHNDGNYGAKQPTGIPGLAFSFAVEGGTVSLEWTPPVSGGNGLFDVRRADVRGVDGLPGPFGALASNLTVGIDGSVRYVDYSAEMGSRYVYALTPADENESIHVSGSIYVPVSTGSLSQNFPNPFNPNTTIDYFVPEGSAQRVVLVVYDVTGARVRTLVDRVVPGGKYSAEWNGLNDRGESVGSGVYFYRLIERNFTQTRKMLLLK